MITNHVDTAQTDVMAVLDGRLEAMRAKDIDRAMSFYAPGIVYFDVIPRTSSSALTRSAGTSCGGLPSTRATSS